MDKIVGFFRDKRVEFGFSFFTPLYCVFLGYAAWLTYAFYLVPINGTLLFLLYVIINLLFCASVIYSRAQALTRFFVCFPNLLSLVLILYGFGNWYLIAPAFITATISFFAAKNSDGVKIVMGTLYLILTVLSVIAYLIMQLLSIQALREVDYSRRSRDYMYSPDKKFRVVQYIDDSKSEHRTVQYYVERSSEDVALPFLNCEKTFGGVPVLTTKYDTEKTPVQWTPDGDLSVDGKIRKIK